MERRVVLCAHSLRLACPDTCTWHSRKTRKSLLLRTGFEPATINYLGLMLYHLSYQGSTVVLLGTAILFIELSYFRGFWLERFHCTPPPSTSMQCFNVLRPRLARAHLPVWVAARLHPCPAKQPHWLCLLPTALHHWNPSCLHQAAWLARDGRGTYELILRGHFETLILPVCTYVPLKPCRLLLQLILSRLIMWTCSVLLLEILFLRVTCYVYIPRSLFLVHRLLWLTWTKRSLSERYVYG